MNNFEKIERIRKKIFHLKNKTVANGCTPSEELAAKDKISELNQIIYSLQNNSHRSYFIRRSQRQELQLDIREIDKQIDIVELEKIV